MTQQYGEDVRVLHLITRLLHGGAEKTTLNTIETLRNCEEQYDVRLGVGNEYDPQRVQRLEQNGIPTTVFRTIRHYNPITAVVAVVAVALHLRRENIDVLHTHSTEAGIIGRFAGFISRTPVVVHEIHGDPLTNDRNAILNGFILLTERISAQITNYLVVKSKKIKQTYLQRGIGTAEQFNVIYHGVNLSQFQEAAEATGERKRSEPHRVIFIGRIAQGKGIFDLLEAINRINMDVELQIVGEGEICDDVREKVEREGMGEHISLLGYRDDVAELLAAADILVLPSYREGTPRVITEALAAGTPVVSTNIAGIPEQVDDGVTGYLVQPGDIKRLRDRIAELLANPEKRRRFGERASRSVTKFDHKAAQECYRNLYANIIESCHRINN